MELTRCMGSINGRLLHSGNFGARRDLYEFNYVTNAPINCNTKDEAEHVLRVGKLPFKAS